MRFCFHIFALAVLLQQTRAAPAPERTAHLTAEQINNDLQPEIIEIIAPARSARETLNSLNFGEPGTELSERNKRTIGILRQMFPTITQIVEDKITQATSLIVQAFGPAIIKGVLSGGGGTLLGAGGSPGDSNGASDTSADDDDEEETATSAATSIKLVSNVPYGDEADDLNARLKNSPGVNEANKIHKRSIVANDEFSHDGIKRRKRYLFILNKETESADENQVSAESNNNEVRVEAPQDQLDAASENQPLDDLTLNDADTDDENRNKRFLNFGLGSSGGNAAAGSGGGSGNFIFDIVRLVAGSSASEPVEDGQAASSDDAGAAKGDGLTEGVPGPITRLFIIANRGIANLIQDLILRLAQTSERIVNFKARLITSII